MGWTPPSSSSQPKNAISSSTNTPLSKAALKNAKRKEKRKEKKDDTPSVPDNWDDEAPETPAPSTAAEELNSVEGEKAVTTPAIEKDQETKGAVANIVDKLADMAVS